MAVYHSLDPYLRKHMTLNHMCDGAVVEVEVRRHPEIFVETARFTIKTKDMGHYAFEVPLKYVDVFHKP